MISDELKLLFEKMHYSNCYTDCIKEDFNGDEEIYDILPYSELKKEHRGLWIIDKEDKMSFKISSHDFKNGILVFVVYHDYYQRYVRIDYKYFNSTNKYKLAMNYFKEKWENDNFKAQIEIDQIAFHKKWKEFFSKYYEYGFTHVEDLNPFKDNKISHEIRYHWAFNGYGYDIPEEVPDKKVDPKKFKKGKKELIKRRRKERYLKNSFWKKSIEYIITSVSNYLCHNTKHTRFFDDYIENYLWEANERLIYYRFGRFVLMWTKAESLISLLSRVSKDVYLCCFVFQGKMRCVTIKDKKYFNEIPDFIKEQENTIFKIGIYKLNRNLDDINAHKRYLNKFN